MRIADIGECRKGERFAAVTRGNVHQTPQWQQMSPEVREAVEVVSTVLPFRCNAYVMRELIDWDRVPNDPMFQLTFPQRGMLSEEDYTTLASLLRAGVPKERIDREVLRIRLALNPHPAGQMTHNVPTHRGEPAHGIQHKYRETVLFFPSNGQTCHAYCTFCFRWAQFVGMEELKFSNNDVDMLSAYLRDHRWVTDVLFTGGDPMIMNTKNLRRYLDAMLHPDLEHVQTIRIGTKSLAYWPQRFVTDADADDLIRLFHRVADSGKHLSIMGHYSHPVELSTDMAREALRRLRGAGVHVRMQSPLIRGVNDDAKTWSDLWRTGVRLGAVPYYMFVERNTGARHYFEVPLARALDLFQSAYRRVSGMARTVRGPSMSALPGKVHILGVTESNGERLFVLEYLQARDPDLVRQPFFAKFDPTAVWFDDLAPATQTDEPFFAAVEPESVPFGRPSQLPVPLEGPHTV